MRTQTARSTHQGKQHPNIASIYATKLLSNRSTSPPTHMAPVGYLEDQLPLRCFLSGERDGIQTSSRFPRADLSQVVDTNPPIRYPSFRAPDYFHLLKPPGKNSKVLGQIPFKENRLVLFLFLHPSRFFGGGGGGRNPCHG